MTKFLRAWKRWWISETLTSLTEFTEMEKILVSYFFPVFFFFLLITRFMRRPFCHSLGSAVKMLSVLTKRALNPRFLSCRMFFTRAFFSPDKRKHFVPFSFICFACGKISDRKGSQHKSSFLVFLWSSRGRFIPPRIAENRNENSIFPWRQSRNLAMSRCLSPLSFLLLFPIFLSRFSLSSFPRFFTLRSR